jgi:hypothetical protein
MASGRHVAESHGIRHQPRQVLRVGQVRSRYDRAPSRCGLIGYRETFVGIVRRVLSVRREVLLSDSDVIGRHVGFDPNGPNFCHFSNAAAASGCCSKNRANSSASSPGLGTGRRKIKFPIGQRHELPGVGNGCPNSRFAGLDEGFPVTCRSLALRRSRDVGPQPVHDGPCAELGIDSVPFSPLGKGFWTGTVNASTTFDTSYDLRSQIPRFSGEALQHNLALAEEVRGVAEAKGGTPRGCWRSSRWIVPPQALRSCNSPPRRTRAGPRRPC